MKDDLSILVATYNRPDAIRYVINNIVHRPLIIIVDSDRDHDIPSDVIKPVTVLHCLPGCGPVKAYETGIEAITTRFILILNDDIKFTSDNWLDEAITTYKSKIGINNDGVVALNDGVQHGLIACFPLFSKKFYMDNCHPMPYKTYFQDTEMTQKALLLKRYAYAERATVTHLRWHTDSNDVMCRELGIFNKRMLDWKRQHRFA